MQNQPETMLYKGLGQGPTQTEEAVVTMIWKRPRYSSSNTLYTQPEAEF